MINITDRPTFAVSPDEPIFAPAFVKREVDTTEQ